VKIPAESGSRFNRLQELVYELKVEAVMSRNLITVQPETPMRDLRAILGDNRNSGTPVTEGRRMVGLISVEDFINWLAQGASDCTVAEKMSRKLRALFSDEPLAHAERLLRELQIDYHEEEIHRYRASHFFEDMIDGKVRIQFRYHIRGKQVEQGGEVASVLKRSPKRPGIHPKLEREVRGGCAGDLLSEVLARAEAGDLWVTVLAHANTVAVAAMKELAGMVLIGRLYGLGVGGRRPDAGEV